MLHTARAAGKWCLVVLGAWCLVYSWSERLGWAATAWFLVAPLIAGILGALSEQRRPPPPGR